MRDRAWAWRAARRYVANYPTFARCRVDGHWWKSVIRSARDGVLGLPSGQTVIAACQRCGSRKTQQFDNWYRFMRDPRIVHPEGWEAFAVGRVAPFLLRKALFEADIAALAHTEVGQ